MVDLQISKATVEDASVMASLLNDAQSEWILALADGPVDECVASAVLKSSHAWSGRVEGLLVAMWGVAPIPDHETIGFPWMYSTSGLRDYPKLTMTMARRVIDDMLAVYPVLFGTVEMANEASVRFAQRLGFSLGQYIEDRRFGTIEKRVA